MSSAKMTLMGMYNYDNTIFNEMLLPAGIDANLFTQSLLMEKGEMEVLYPNPQFMKGAVKIWSLKWYDTFKKWLKGVEADWNPIYNYDRFEEGWDDQHKRYESLNKADYSDKRTADLTEKDIVNLEDKRTADLTDERTADLTDERTADLTDTRTADLEENRITNLKDEQTKNLKDESLFNNADVTSQTKEGTTEHKVAAYDSSTYQESSMDIINNGDSKTAHLGTVTNESTGTDTMAHTGTDAVTTSGTDTMAHSGTDTMVHSGTDTMVHSGTDTMNHTGSNTKDTTGTDEMLHKGTLSDLAGKEQNTNQHTAHLYGNIGVTTSSAMVAEWYAISKWNIFEHMADVFCSELLIPVY